MSLLAKFFGFNVDKVKEPAPGPGEVFGPAENPVVDPTSVGNILMVMGRVSEHQLRTACLIQASKGPAGLALGQVVKDMGLASDDDIAFALGIQKKMREGKDAEAGIDCLRYATRQMAETRARLDRSIESTRYKAKMTKSGVMLRLATETGAGVGDRE